MSESVHTHVIHTDGDVAVSIRTTRRELFFSFMHWIVDTGRLRDMSGTAAKVYLAIGRFCDFKARTCQVSTARIARAAGVSRASVFGVLPELMRLGVLECETGQTESDTRAAAPNRYRLPGKIPQGGSKNPIPPIQNLDNPLSKKPAEPYPESGHLLERQERETAARENAAAVSVLTEHKKFTHREACELAALAGGSVARCRAAMNRLQHLEHQGKLRGTRYGFVSAAIVGEYADTHAMAPTEGVIARIEQTSTYLSEQREANRLAETSLAQIRAALAAMPPAELQLAVTETMQGLGPTVRRAIATADVQQSNLLAVSVWHHLQKRKGAEVTA